MAGSVPARDGGAIGIRRQAKPRRTLTGHSDQPDMRLLDKEIDDWQAVHSGGSARGYQRDLRDVGGQQTRGRFNMQPSGLNTYTSQSCPENARSCRDDERPDHCGVCWVCNVKLRTRSPNWASAVPTVGADPGSGSDERPQRPKAGLMATSIESNR
jgi:hypothetical protein